MNITLAKHHGMCFGVRDALRTTHQVATTRPLTVLGQLVHNPEVDKHLNHIGAKRGDLTDLNSANTLDVVITAHGAADVQRAAWRKAGHVITDTTCPLVRKAHDALALIVSEGYCPVVIGQAQHAEVRGLTGDFPNATVVLEETDLHRIPSAAKIGLISQTTLPLEKALRMIDSLKRTRPGVEVRFIDTICHPTKQRQTALEELCRQNEVIVVIGGNNSNNTHQLAEKARALGCTAIQIEKAADLQPQWFSGVKNVGVTAGTSTLDETVNTVVAELRRIASEQNHNPYHEFLRLVSRVA
jgi:4-hydroxy-3-methylbut-2-en-1-yl diphosphate reductase